MAKFIYCSKCGEKSQIYVKAIQGYGVIIRYTDPHVCHDEPIDLDLTPVEVPQGSDQQFVEKLNGLRPSRTGISTQDLRDRRSAETIKTTAPASVLDQLKLNKEAGINSIPEGDIGKDPDDA